MSRAATRSWVREAVRNIEADANRSADTHLRVFPLPPEWGIDLYLKDESTHPTGCLKHRLARSLFLYGAVQRLDRPGHPGHRGVQRLDRRLRGLLRPAARRAVHRRRCPGAPAGEDRADRVPRRQLPLRRRARRDVRRGRAARRPRAAGTTWTSSPTPSAPPTGAATTTSPSRSSSRWRSERHPSPGVDRRRRRHRRHQRHHRPLRALPAARHAGLRRRPGELGRSSTPGRPGARLR